MSESSDREERIFADALAIPLGNRQRYLDEACQGDDDLRRRIEALVRAYESAGGFMAEPPPAGPADPVRAASSPPVVTEAAGDCAASPPPAGRADPVRAASSPPVVTEAAGDLIGRYKLLQRLGEGGCGVVWMAEQQEPVRRRVALKIIKLGMDTKEVIARFEAERQALAMMDHPNIAKIIDAGATGTGRPFFVMELVRGIKITDFCDRNNLSTRQIG